MSPFPVSHATWKLCEVIKGFGGHPIIVGGAVRDHLMGKVFKDIDIEVFGLDGPTLREALERFFHKVDAVGESFGVLKVRIGSEDFDVSLPRRERKAGVGHKGFDVDVDPSMSFKEACQRRDLTVNAIGWDCTRGEFVDPVGGIDDLACSMLRHVSPRFAEDPLRVLRVAQFAARFEFLIAPETIELCRGLAHELSSLPKERLWEEWKKLFTKGRKPSLGLQFLLDTGALGVIAPELQALNGVPQDPQWHPEGECFRHSTLVINNAVRVCDEDGLAEDDPERLLVVLGACCHDLGKPAVTEFKDGRWRAHAHDKAGLAPTQAFLERNGCPPSVIEAILPLVEHHLRPHHAHRDHLKGVPLSDGAIRRLAMAAPPVRLCRVARADNLGSLLPEDAAKIDSREIVPTNWFLERCAGLNVQDSKPKPILLGRHLIELGHKPSPEFRPILDAAFEAQLDGDFSDLEGALAWLKGTIHLLQTYALEEKGR